MFCVTWVEREESFLVSTQFHFHFNNSSIACSRSSITSRRKERNWLFMYFNKTRRYIIKQYVFFILTDFSYKSRRYDDGIVLRNEMHMNFPTTLKISRVGSSLSFCIASSLRYWLPQFCWMIVFSVYMLVMMCVRSWDYEKDGEDRVSIWNYLALL